jgi:hypothetical protein
MPRRSINGHSRRRSSAFKKKNSGMTGGEVAVSALSPVAGIALLTKEHKRKRAAKWYSAGKGDDQWSAQEEELGNLASTGVTIPPGEAI